MRQFIIEKENGETRSQSFSGTEFELAMEYTRETTNEWESEIKELGCGWYEERVNYKQVRKFRVIREK